MMPISAICLLHLAVVCADPPGTRTPPAVVNEDEAFLQTHAKIASDNENLLKVLRERAALSETISRLDAIVEQLGNSSYEKRQEASKLLLACGHLALPALRKRFTKSHLEFARRAKECAAIIESDIRPVWDLPVVKLVLKRKPAGAFEALLAFLPCTLDPAVEEEIYYGLDELIENGKSMPFSLVQALEDGTSARRAVAACIIGRRGNAEQQAKVRKLMASDRDPYVRLRAAQGVLASRDKSAIPVLIELLREPSVAIGWQAEELLRWSTETPVEPVFGGGRPAERTTCQEAWTLWWKQNESSFTWARSFVRPGSPGMTLVWNGCYDKTPYITDFSLVGCDGVVRYKLVRSTSTMHAIWLPDGRILSFTWMLPNDTVQIVEELDLAGQLLRKFAIEMRPTAWRRLSNGNMEFTVEPERGFTHPKITCDETGKVLRLSVGDGELAEFPQRPVLLSANYAPLLLRNGNKIVMSSLTGVDDGRERLIEVTREGKVTWESFCWAPPRPWSVFPLTRFGFSAPADAPSLDSLAYRLKCLQSKSEDERICALKQIEKCPLTEEIWLSVLKVASERPLVQNRSSLNTRALALDILSAGPESLCTKHLSSFLDLLRLDLFQDVTGAYNGLGRILRKIGPEKVVPALLRIAEEQSTPENAIRRASAIDHLGTWFLGEGKQVEEALKGACFDSQAIVQRAAMKALYLRTFHRRWQEDSNYRSRFVPGAIQVLENPDKETAKSALVFLEKCGRKAELARPKLLTMLRDRKDLRPDVIRALNALKPQDAALVPMLLPYLDKKEGSKVVAIVVTCFDLDDMPKEALQPLIRLLVSNPNPNPNPNEKEDFLSKDLLVALGKYGPDAKTAVPHLKKLFRHGSGYDAEIVSCLEQIDPTAGKEARGALEEIIRFQSSPIPAVRKSPAPPSDSVPRK